MFIFGSKLKKGMAVLLSMVMLIGCFSTRAFAAEDDGIAHIPPVVHFAGEDGSLPEDDEVQPVEGESEASGELDIEPEGLEANEEHPGSISGNADKSGAEFETEPGTTGEEESETPEVNPLDWEHIDVPVDAKTPQTLVNGEYVQIEFMSTYVESPYTYPLDPLTLDAPEGSVILEAFRFANPSEWQYAVVTLTTMPHIRSTDTLYLYTLTDGVISAEPYLEFYSVNNVAYLSLRFYDGFALVRCLGEEPTPVEQTISDLQPEAGVSVALEGMMPEGSTVDIQVPQDQTVSALQESVNDYGWIVGSYHFTIYDGDGFVYEPSTPITVTIQNEEIADAVEAGLEIVVLHTADYAGAPPAPEEATILSVEDDTVVFAANGFSTYTIAASNAKVADSVVYVTDDFYLSGKLPGGAIVDYEAVEVNIDGERTAVAYEISIYANQKQKEKGKTWKPAPNKVQVHFYSERFSEREIHVYHLEKAGAAAQYVTSTQADGNWIGFDAGSFSVYAATYTIETTIQAADGNTYRVRVTFDDKSGIPVGATLDVSEITDTDKLMAAAQALGEAASGISYAKLFDISIVKDGVEIQPNAGSTVTVSVELLDADQVGNVQVVHFAENEGADPTATPLTATTQGNTVTFETEGFSLFSFLDFSVFDKIIGALLGETEGTLYENDDIILTGKMPSTAVVVANRVDTAVEGQNALVAYDITIYAHPFLQTLGIPWQPTDGAIQVQMKSDALIVNSVDVYHMATASAENTQLVAEEIAVENGSVTFNADEFSVYVIIDHEGNSVVTTPRVEFHYINHIYSEITTTENNVTIYSYSAGPYNFYNKGNERQTTQILTDGETLEMIANPPTHMEYNPDGTIKSEKYFFGWYVVALNGTDSTYYDAATGTWKGTIPYVWTSNPIKVDDEIAMTLDQTTGLHVGDTVTWTIGTASASGILDDEGIVHVYLAPIYEDFFFLNFRMAMWNDTENQTLANSLLTRRLVVFGSDTSKEVRIGNVICPSPDVAHKVFAGWQEYGNIPTDYYATVDLEASNSDVTVENNSSGHSDGYWITITKQTGVSYYDLYPVFAEARWLYYNLGKSGNGAVYLPASWRLTNDQGAGTYYSKLETSTRQGYNFVGWYVNAAMEDGEIKNLSGGYTLTVTANGVTTTTTYNEAIQITDGSGNFVNAVKGKVFYSDTNDGTGTSKLYSAASMPAGDNYKKLFEITADGKLYFYTDLNDLTVHALWDAKLVNYKVLFWEQNADDDGYALVYYTTKQDIAGTVMYVNTTGDNNRTVYLDSDPDHNASGRIIYQTINLTTTELANLEYLHLCTTQYKDYNGYTTTKVNNVETTTETGVEIAGDESTLINIYYDRNLYTLRFDMGYSYQTSNTGTTTSYEPMTSAEAATYTGTVYGYVNGALVTLTKDINGNWICLDSVNGVPYGTVNGQYVPLDVHLQSSTQFYKPRFIYSTTTNDSDGLFGLVNNEYVALDHDSETTSTTTWTYTKTTYTLTSSTGTSSGLYYLDGSTYIQLRANSSWLGGTTWYKYAYTSTTATNNQTFYGLVDYGDGNQIYVPLTRQNNGSYFTLQSGEIYTGTRYTRGNGNNTQVSNPTRYNLTTGSQTGNTYPADSTRYTRNNSTFTATTATTGTLYGLVGTNLYAQLTSSTTSVTTHTYTYGNNNTYTDTRYTQTRNNSSTAQTYPETDTTHIVTRNGEVFFHDTAGEYGAANAYIPVDDAGTQDTYTYSYNGANYTGSVSLMSVYSGTLYKATTTTGTITYYVSQINNQTNYGEFLTGSRVEVSRNAMPVDFAQYETYTTQVNGTTYTVYYYDLTAKYGANIADRWPSKQPDRGNYRFIGWLPHQASYYREYYDTTSSIKGIYETMSEYIIMVKRDNNGNYSTNGTYSAVTADQGYTLELRCRYHNTVNKYVYRIYFWDPILPGNGYPTEPNYELQINSQGEPRYRTLFSYDGYKNGENDVIIRVIRGSETNAEEPITNSMTYSAYPVSSVGYNAMIINYYYTPKQHHVTINWGSGASDDSNNSLTGPITAFATDGQYDVYYNQKISTAIDEAQYRTYAEEHTPLGHQFAGFYSNFDGLGDPFDFDSKMPDGDVPIFAVYTPIKYRVIIDPNGGEIDHIDHSGGNYAPYPNYLPDGAFNRDTLYRIDDNGNTTSTVERAADSGYDKSQSTYFTGSYGEMVGEYTVSRKYVPISDQIAENYQGHLYYYIYMPYYDGYGLASDNRNAIYVEVTDGAGQYINDDPAQGETEIYRYWKFYYGWTKGNLDGNYLKGAEIVGYGTNKQPLDFDSWKSMYVTKQNGTNKAQVYRAVTDNEQYVFQGWFKVKSDNSLESMPYNFADPVRGEMTLRAVWRLDGGYKIQYHADYTTGEGTINGEMDAWVDPKAGASTLSYSSGAMTQVYKAPYDITLNGASTDEYIFRGFRVVGVKYTYKADGVTVDTVSYTPLEKDENDNVIYYDPGDDFTIKADYADSQGYIHLQAVYEKKDSSYRRPYVTNLTLDANGGYLTTGTGYVSDGNGGYTWQDGTALTENTNLTYVSGWSWIGTVAATVVDENTNQPLTYPLIEFGDIQSNQAVHLYRYATTLQTVGGNGQTPLDPYGMNYFEHPQRYFLLGFDDSRAETEDFIAKYPADSIISINRNMDETIYAVWEPMIYLNIKNETSEDIRFGISAESAMTLYILNQVTGLYDRVKCDDPENVVVEAGKTMRMALPLAEEKTITISGMNELGIGKILTWDTSITDDDTGVTKTTRIDGPNGEILHQAETYTHQYNNASCDHVLAYGDVNSEVAAFSFDEKLLFNSKGVTVTFGEQSVDYALVLDDNYPGGSAQEFDFTNNYIQETPHHSLHLPSTSTRMGWQLLGWAYDPDATTPDFSATSPSGNPWTIADLNDFFLNNPDAPVGGWPTINADLTTEATLYAVWDVNDAANTVYIYKDVPAPGNQNAAFTFTLELDGTYRRSGTQNTTSHASGTFELKHGDYAILRSKAAMDLGTMRTEIAVFKADGTERTANFQLTSDTTVNKSKYYYTLDTETGQYTPVEDANVNLATGTYYEAIHYVMLQASNAGTGGGWEAEKYTVTETGVTYYTTTITCTAQNADEQLYIGTHPSSGTHPAAATVDGVVTASAAHWDDSMAGGTLVFTNTRQTYNITLEKSDHTNVPTGGTYNFVATYILDNDTAHPYTVSGIQVIAGTPNDNPLNGTPVGLHNMPAGAVLTIEELSDGSYETMYKIDSGSWTDGTVVTNLVVDGDKTVYFDNTLKSYAVDFMKVDQALLPNVNGMFNLTGPASFSLMNLRAQSQASGGDGVFYDHTVRGNLWVGNYTLTETSTSDGYRGLNGPVTITVDGSATEGNNVTCTDQNILIDYDSTSKVYTVYVINQQIVNVTVAKTLHDPLVASLPFEFTASYNVSYEFALNSGTVTRSFSSTETFTVNSGSANVVTVPVGASFVVTENNTVNREYTIYDITYKVGSGDYETGTTNYTYSATINSAQTVIFRNTRKTVPVTVKKVVDGSSSDSFRFVVTIMGLREQVNPQTGYYTDRTGRIYYTANPTISGDAESGYTVTHTDPSFSLGHNEEIVLTVPYGARLTINELDGDDQTTVQVGTNAAVTSQSITLTNTQTINALTVTFNNTVAILAPTDVKLHTKPYHMLLIGGVLMIALPVAGLRVRRKREEDDEEFLDFEPEPACGAYGRQEISLRPDSRADSPRGGDRL